MKWINALGLYTMAWVAITGLLVYLFLALVISGKTLILAVSSLNLGVSVAVLLTWAPAAIFSIRRRAIGKNQLIIAVFAIFLSLGLARSYGILFNYYGQPDSWPDNTIRGFLGYLVFIAGALFLVAPAYVDEPEVNYKLHLISATIVGTLLAIASYFLQM